ncbi:DUF4038 domain-containing protein [Paenibacillus antri]|uniref:DUF4038 domain-containing protein n=1 Tax=Paenibacillus antri TaxID=2582848 RepID=A0A5R9GA99_9BACL|nr:DUF4038 domain-containing protein [Paenibacillus antri]TLS51286.1 DUF4038 domain-containing protein [Paenibacillus antri]
MGNRLQVWNAVELTFEAERETERPYAELAMTVAFVSPSGRRLETVGFWAEGRRWLARFAPDEAGAWRWSSSSADGGLGGKEGAFDVDPYEGEHRLYRHGFIGVHPSGRAFAHADGTPFFWLGDTVWSAPAHATLEEWQRYVAYRGGQGFNVAQINALPQWDASGAPLRLPFERRDDGTYDLTAPNPDYFRTLDVIVAASAAAGLVPAIVALWFNYVPGTNLNWDFEVDRPFVFDPASASRFATFLAARYAAFGAVWLVSGDTDFARPETMPVYDAAAEAIRSASPYPPLLTVHMVGGLSTPELANEKPWLSFHMYQSGHSGKSARTARRQAAADRAYEPARPVLNGEPCYEHIRIGDDGGRTSDRAYVRRVEWASALTGGNAGLAYGAHGLWPWHREGHPYEFPLYGDPLPWETALRLEGGADAVRLKTFLSALPWWALEPRDDATAEPAPVELAAAGTPDGDVAALYVSSPCRLELPIAADRAYEGEWFDPATGRTTAADVGVARRGEGAVLVVEPHAWDGDAALTIRRTEANR